MSSFYCCATKLLHASLQALSSTINLYLAHFSVPYIRKTCQAFNFFYHPLVTLNGKTEKYRIDQQALSILKTTFFVSSTIRYLAQVWPAYSMLQAIPKYLKYIAMHDNIFYSILNSSRISLIMAPEAAFEKSFKSFPGFTKEIAIRESRTLPITWW